MLGCGNRSQPSVITANTKLMEQMDSIIGDIYERDTIKGDFNGDGNIEYAYSESNPAEYYSLDKVDDGKLNNITWKKLLRLDYDALNPPSDVCRPDPNRPGYVIVQTVEWEDGESTPIEKTVKIK